MNAPIFTPYEPMAVDFICASIALLILFTVLLSLGWWLDTRLELEALTHAAPEPETTKPDEAAHLPPFTGTDFGFLEDPHTVAARRQFLATAARINAPKS